ncbi:MAG: class I SAM-dependent methyltransferase [Actinobacteria bacterium]|nr:class I SAM-dependent methyltransferase [Actinomycetota bacterium]
MPAVHAGAQAFGGAGDAYERGRPTYPADAVAWMAMSLRVDADARVVDLAAGTGKFTRVLSSFAPRLIAVEPLQGMWRHLHAASPELPVVAATAERIPLRNQSVDAVTVAQAFHWFRAEEALGEIRRVLRPGGRLGMVWNRRDQSVPWVAELGRLLDRYERDTPRFAKGLWAKAFESNAPFTPLEERSFRHEQELDVAGLQDRVGSVSFVAALDADEKARVLDEVAGIASGLGERFALPYVTEVFCCSRR